MISKRWRLLDWATIFITLGSIAVAHSAQYQVGPTRPYRSVGALPALNPGDIVEVDPSTYHEVKRWTRSGTLVSPIIVRGVGDTRPIFDATGLTVDGSLPNPRAVFQVEANFVSLENLEFRNARNGDNGAGVRVTSGNNVTIRNCLITQCDMGIMSDNNSNLLIEASEICSNGTSLFDGYSHNFYLGGTSATIRSCYIHDSLYGQNFKARTHYVELLYNYITQSQDGEIGLVDAKETAATNSHAVMIGNIVVSKPRLSGYNSSRFIQFGQDGGGQHNGTLFAFNNTFVAGDGRIQFLSANAPGAAILAMNNIFYGSDKIIGTLGGGISGTNNWMPGSANVPPTFQGSTKGSLPGFVAPGRDFRLMATSNCRDQGVSPLTFLDGLGGSHSGIPSQEYVHPLQNRARPVDQRLDLGAYEYRLPKVTALTPMGPEWLISFTAQPGGNYDLQRSEDVAGQAWLATQTNIPGVDGTIQVVDSNAVGLPRSFYRVKVAN